MPAFEHNYRDFQPTGNTEADKGLLVKFFFKPRLDKGKSKVEQRPIYRDVEYIDIKIPGNRSAGASRPATPEDKTRFNEHYRLFKERLDQDTVQGTPLLEWSPIGRSQAEELAFFHVKTVEQLATMSDTQVSKFMGLIGLREQAKLWLEKAGEEKKFFEIHNELLAQKQENVVLAEHLAKLSDEINELKNIPSLMQKKPKKVKKQSE